MKFLIWSFEHNAWWKPGGEGYTVEQTQAGEYTYEKAIEILEGANIAMTHNGAFPHEAMVPIL